MKLAFAITMYDNIENTRLLIETINYNFKNTYISIDCNNLKFKKEDFKNMNYNNLNINYRFDNIKEGIYGVGLRQIDSWYNLTIDCIKNSNCDYLIYTHNDTIILNNKGLENILKYFENKKIHFLTKSMGLTYKYIKQGLGDIFFLARISYLQKNNIFRKYEELLLTDKSTSIHQYILNSIRYGSGLSKLKIYDNYNNMINIINGKNINPWIGSTWKNAFDKNLCIIHSDIHHSNIDNKKFLCFFFKKYNCITPYIKEYLQKYDKNIKLEISNYNSNDIFQTNW